MKRLAREVLGHPLISSRLRPEREECAVLAYHRFARRSEFENGFDPNLNIAVHEHRFEEQLKYLSQHMRCLSMDELIVDLLRGSLRARSVVVTIDDGYLDNLTLAKPLLEHYRIPAIIYVTTGFLNGMKTPWWFELEDIVEARSEITFLVNGKTVRLQARTPQQKDFAYEKVAELLKSVSMAEGEIVLQTLRDGIAPVSREAVSFLSDAQLLELSRNPWITIGAHTVSHPSLAVLPVEEMKKELIVSRDLLEGLIGKSISHFAFPFGQLIQAGTREYQAAEELGFQSAVTTLYGFVNNEARGRQWALPRIHIDYTDTMGDFRYKVSGVATYRRQGWYGR